MLYDWWTSMGEDVFGLRPAAPVKGVAASSMFYCRVRDVTRLARLVEFDMACSFFIKYCC